MGDEADFFEWSAFYQMWLSTRVQLDVLELSVAGMNTEAYLTAIKAKFGEQCHHQAC
jgi:hypothetical protein